MNLWLSVALRSLWRHPARSTICLLGIAGAVFQCVYLANLQKGSYDSMLYNGVRSSTGHVVLRHQDFKPENKIAAVFPESMRDQLLAGHREEFETYSRIHINTLARSSRGSEPALLMGLELQKELKTHPFLRSAEFQPRVHPLGKESDAAMGKRLAKTLGLDIGHKFVIMHQAATGTIHSMLLRLRATLQTGVRTLDERLILTSLKTAQEAAQAANQLHETAILLENPKNARQLLHDLQSRSPSSKLKIQHWKEALPQLLAMIRLDRANGILLAVFLFLIVAVGTLNSLMIGVMEREKEFGLLRAMGLKLSQIQAIVLFEGLLLGLIGSAIGWTLAITLSWFTSIYGIDFSSVMGAGMEAGGTLVEPVLYTGWDKTAMAVIPLTMILISFLGALWPARTASRIQPAEAMRRNG